MWRSEQCLFLVCFRLLFMISLYRGLVSSPACVQYYLKSVVYLAVFPTSECFLPEPRRGQARFPPKFSFMVSLYSQLGFSTQTCSQNRARTFLSQFLKTEPEPFSSLNSLKTEPKQFLSLNSSKQSPNSSCHSTPQNRAQTVLVTQFLKTEPKQFLSLNSSKQSPNSSCHSIPQNIA